MKGAIGGIDLCRIVPLVIASVVIPKIGCLPIGVVAGVK
jgi:hypothetical protein